ncbi:MAG: hypothetical protein ACJAZ1_000088 [Yoonia sp.]|jgi:hypothetical protein
MTFRADRVPASGAGDYPLETVRALAVVLLVSYHVIGSGPGAGLHLDYPHVGRLLADALVDVRMPLFAFIAGYVYAMRPVARSNYAGFLRGKFHRLYIPGVVAAFAFAVTSLVFIPSNGLDVSVLWHLFFLPFAHYWFLQAILLIFILYGALDAALNHRGTGIILALSILAYFYYPRPLVNFMSFSQAVYLLPYFLLGVLFLRRNIWIDARSGWIIASGLVVIALGLWWNLQILADTGHLSADRDDLHSLGTGFAVCAVCVLGLPRVRAVEVIGPFAFTIYLYHIFGTAGMRELLQWLEITQIPVLFFASLAAGIGVPVAVHLTAKRFALTRRFVLGKSG